MVRVLVEEEERRWKNGRVQKDGEGGRSPLSVDRFRGFVRGIE